MSKRMTELNLRELRAAQAAVRSEPADAAAFSLLLGIDRQTAACLLRPGVHTPAIKLAVLLRLTSRLRSADATRDEVCEAMRVHRQLQREEATSPARDLTMDEIRAAEALLRGQDADIGATSDLLGCSTAAVRRLLLIAGDSRALDGLVIATLLLRLHGRRVGLAEMGEAFLAVFGNRAAELLREAAH